jgi:hypothetical protein
MLNEKRPNDAFSDEERQKFGVEGLLPSVPTSLNHQMARIHTQLAMLDNDLQKYLFLSDLQARNQTLYYAVLMSDPAGFMPVVYTPTVGAQKFDHIVMPPAESTCRFRPGVASSNCFQIGSWSALQSPMV